MLSLPSSGRCSWISSRDRRRVRPHCAQSIRLLIRSAGYEGTMEDYPTLEQYRATVNSTLPLDAFESMSFHHSIFDVADRFPQLPHIFQAR